MSNLKSVIHVENGKVFGGGTTSSTTRKVRKDITDSLSKLSKAVEEQDLEKYGYIIGDYFIGPTSNYVYHLADLDTYYGEYDSYAVVSTHHVSIVVDTKTSSQWYTSDDTSKGYAGSTLHTYLTGTVSNNIKADMKALFGGDTGLEHLVSHSKILTNSLTGWAWTANLYISALTECDVYGCPIWSLNGTQQGEAIKQLDLFKKHRFNEIYGNNLLWLRSINSSISACLLGYAGHADSGKVSISNIGATGIILFR